MTSITLAFSLTPCQGPWASGHCIKKKNKKQRATRKQSARAYSVLLGAPGQMRNNTNPLALFGIKTALTVWREVSSSFPPPTPHRAAQFSLQRI